MQPDVRARIVEKLSTGQLPKERARALKPASAEHRDAEWWIGSGPAGDCAGCDEPIKAGEMFHGFRRESGPIRLHEACQRVLDEERPRVR
jgi:hypothetical protein